jgi:hypothetical protein
MGADAMDAEETEIRCVLPATAGGPGKRNSKAPKRMSGVVMKLACKSLRLSFEELRYESAPMSSIVVD